MSRIGKLPITLPEKVEAKISDSNIEIKGPKGTLDFSFVADKVSVSQEEQNIVVTPKGEDSVALWGTTRAIINNMVEGVTQGFQKGLQINGVGYKFEIQGKKLILSVGFSHKVEVEIPAGIEVTAHEKDKSIIYISGVDKQAVGEFAANIRAYKKPEPYKGKGIKYLDEHIRRKAGKTGK